MKHKHAEFFIAIANGELVDSWETRHLGTKKWSDLYANLYLIATFPEDWEVRRKQVTHKVNGFTVPAPLKVAPAVGTTYFYPAVYVTAFALSAEYADNEINNKAIKRGIVHLTEEAAIANAKAMCGINPESNDE